MKNDRLVLYAASMICALLIMGNAINLIHLSNVVYFYDIENSSEMTLAETERETIESNIELILANEDINLKKEDLDTLKTIDKKVKELKVFDYTNDLSSMNSRELYQFYLDSNIEITDLSALYRITEDIDPDYDIEKFLMILIGESGYESKFVEEMLTNYRYNLYLNNDYTSTFDGFYIANSMLNRLYLINDIISLILESGESNE